MNDPPVRVAFLMTDAETVALTVHATAPDWRGRRGGAGWTAGLSLVGLFPLAAAAALAPFDLTAAGVTAGGLLVTGPLLIAAVVNHRGGAWLDAVRRRRVERAAAKHAAAHELAGFPRAMVLDRVGVSGEGGGNESQILWRSWTRCRHVDVIPVPDAPPGGGDADDAEPDHAGPGEMLVVAATLGGPAPVAPGLPRRAVADAGLDFEAVVRRCEAWRDAADPAGPHPDPPPRFRPPPDAPAVTFAPTGREYADFCAARRPTAPAAAVWAAVAAVAACVAGPLLLHAEGVLTADAAYLMGLSGAGAFAVAFAAVANRRGWAGGAAYRAAAGRRAEVDPALLEPKTLAASNRGVHWCGAGFAVFLPWHPTARPGRDGRFVLLPTGDGDAYFAPVRAFGEDNVAAAAAADRFVRAADRRRTGRDRDGLPADFSN